MRLTKIGLQLTKLTQIIAVQAQFEPSQFATA